MKVTEEQIRPSELFNRYLELAQEDALWLVNTAKFEPLDCWACGSALHDAFEKCGFRFGECPNCHSIIANPRPTAVDISRFYREGKSPNFWATDFYRTTAESRRKLLWKPKAIQLLDIIKDQLLRPDWICDIGAGYGIFIEEFRLIAPDIPIIAVEPTPSLAAELRNKGIHTIEKFLGDVSPSDLPSGRGFFTSFELLEHLHDPATFLRNVRAIGQNGGGFLATTLSSWGLDIQLLGKDSKAIFPPHHLQILSPKAVQKLALTAGFKSVEISTPGKLDVDIAKKSLNLVQDKFWKVFLSEASDDSLTRMQNLIANTGFSSHMWCLFQN